MTFASLSACVVETPLLLPPAGPKLRPRGRKLDVHSLSLSFNGGLAAAPSFPTISSSVRVSLITGFKDLSLSLSPFLCARPTHTHTHCRNFVVVVPPPFGSMAMKAARGGVAVEGEAGRRGLAEHEEAAVELLFDGRRERERRRQKAGTSARGNITMIEQGLKDPEISDGNNDGNIREEKEEDT